MHRLTLGFVFMAGDAGGGIGLGVKWDRMFRSGGTASKQKGDDHETSQRLKLAPRSETQLE